MDYGRLEYDFLGFAFVTCVLIFLFSPGLSRYVNLLRVPSSVQQSSATLSKCEYVVRALSCVVCFLPHFSEFFCFIRLPGSIFSQFLFLRWRFGCALVPGTSALGLPTLIISRLWSFFSVSLSVTT